MASPVKVTFSQIFQKYSSNSNIVNLILCPIFRISEEANMHERAEYMKWVCIFEIKFRSIASLTRLTVSHISRRRGSGELRHYNFNEILILEDWFLVDSCHAGIHGAFSPYMDFFDHLGSPPLPLLNESSLARRSFV